MMRNIILILFLLSNLSAQNSSDTKTSATLNVSVNVIDHLEMITLRNINIGTVLPSQILIDVDPRIDPGAGLIKVSGQNFSPLELDFTQQIEMVNSITNGILLVKYNISGGTTNNQNSSVKIIETPKSIILSNSGEYFIWVGCSFNLSDIEPGSYDGEFGIEVDYVN